MHSHPFWIGIHAGERLFGPDLDVGGAVPLRGGCHHGLWQNRRVDRFFGSG